MGIQKNMKINRINIKYIINNKKQISKLVTSAIMKQLLENYISIV